MQYLIPIRLNSSVGTISAATWNFLFELGDFLRNQTSHGSRKLCDAIAVSAPRDIDQQELFQRVIDSIEDIDAAEQIILDVGGPNSDGVPVNRVVGSLLAVLYKLKRLCPKAHKLVAFPKSLNPRDMNRLMFEDLVLNDSTVSCFFYNTQEVQGKGHDGNLAISTNPLLLQLYSRVNQDRRSRLKSRLICHLGKYELGRSGKIVYDFYRGEYADDEIYYWIKRELRRIVEAKGSNELTQVILDDSYSPWFVEPFENARKHLQNDGAMLNVLGLSQDSWSAQSKNIDAVFTPIVRTGRTFLDAMVRAQAEGLLSNFQDPYLWTLVDVSGGKREGDTTTVTVASGEGSVDLVVHAVHSESARGKSLSELWNGAHFAARSTDRISQGLGREFTSDEMWAHVFEAGLKNPENFVPRNRGRHEILPNFEELIRLNGPLLAAKVEAIIQGLPQELSPSNLALVFPKEDAAMLLADAIHEMTGYEHIGVSKELIEQARFAKSSQRMFESDSNVRAEQLQDLELEYTRLEAKYSGNNLTLKGPLKVVGLTEFFTTGGSIQGINNLARFLGWHMISDISLAALPLQGEHAHIRTAANTFYRFG